MLQTLITTATPAPGLLLYGRQEATRTRTNLGPLTTAWTPPSDCQRVYAACDTCSVIFAAQACRPDVADSLADEQSCWPPRTNNGGGPTTTSGALGGWGVYSPGIVCPAGFTSVVASTYGVHESRFQFPLSAGETAVGCCPTISSLRDAAFLATVDGSGHQTCRLVLSTGAVDLVRCTSPGSTTVEARSVPWSSGNSTMSQYDIYAPLIQIVWKSTDIPPGALPPANIVASATSSVTTTTTTNTSPSLEPLTWTGWQKSMAVLGGAITAVVFCCLALLFAVFWSLWKEIKARQRRPLAPSPAPGELADGNEAATGDAFWIDGDFYDAPPGQQGYHGRESDKTLVRKESAAAAAAENIQLSADHGQNNRWGPYQITPGDNLYNSQVEANVKFAGMPPALLESSRKPGEPGTAGWQSRLGG
ncbi:uncharacterized protein B0I36DRAFT_369148 [Microdochium trichocladiopsis]|uniref:Uncharacterized protein n=1 Tax=Microdochium trichocladiopsis TaxID=1682393 RepID=A0A9P9BG04_9PEZI|nr:uncharacterized protein B0I36DRAFT_369148 [Microdochium trichocladiopsis]KAH7014159.1 hypothetical protein B0I36DRAFT_369148 [Microdochium trichocladiopsis]